MADEDKTIGRRGNKGDDIQDVHSTGRAGGRRNNDDADVHSTGRAGGRRNNDDADVHSTGRAGGRRNNDDADVHSTGRAGGRRNNDDADVHSTGRAGGRRNNDDADVHSTGRAGGRGNNQEPDAHSTGKANARSNEENVDLKPFEQRNSVNITGNTSNVAATGKLKWPDFFELEGKRYKNEGILSDSSGEAIVFTVSRDGKKFALKLYYYDPDHRPNHKILEKIRQLGGSGLLVPIVSHGEWNNPDLPGEKNDYELMEFCEGGSLDGVILEGNEKALTEVAVKMGAAIDFLAKHGILHRDIKPANFFYKDKAKTQIVLADFGISVECPEGGFVKIDEMRSPVYAAPEFYTNVPGEPAEVGVESDYFSLGVALLCLWMGKAKLTANESKLLRAKLNETLPMPGDMSHHMVSLLKALTRLKMKDRANFEDIKRWVKGEDLDNEGQGDVNSNFHVVFNSAKNQVAHSPAELAHYLLEDKVLGKKYIYSGRVTKWLEETGRNEIAVNVEEVVEKIQPRNQEAGLMTVVYMLDPAMDYVSPQGTRMSDPAEISRYAIKHLHEMKSEVLEDDTNLKIYFRALRLDKVLDQLDDYLIDDDFDTGDYDLNAYLATYYLAEQFNDLPLPVEVEGTFEFANDIDELYALIRKDGDGVVNTTNEAMLKSPGFILWLAYRDPAIAGKIRKLIDSHNYDVDSIYYNSDSPYRILYELDPNVDFEFNTDPEAEDRFYTIPEIGGKLAHLLRVCQVGNLEDDSFSYIFENMDSNRYGDYLRARGEAYFNFLKWNRYCMDTEDEENNQKAGPYDEVIGAYKSVSGFLGHAPTYVLEGQVVASPDDLKKFPRDVVAKALGGEKIVMPDGDGTPVPWLAEWLTVFFQENPKLDLSKKFTYEKETAKYIEFIGSLDPKNFYAQRYNRAIKQIDTASKKLEKSDKKVKRNRIFFLLLAGIPTLMILGLSWFFAIPEVNPITGNFLATWLICFIALAICAGIMFESFFGSLLPGAIGGLIVAGIAWAGYAWFPSVLYFIAGAIVLAGAILSVIQLFRRDKVDTGGKVISGNMFEYRQLDALYFTFHDVDQNIENAITIYSQEQRNYDKETRSGMASIGWFWAASVWMIFLIWFFATPELSGHYSWVHGRVGAEKPVPGKWVLGTWEFKIGSGTRIICNIDSVENGKDIYGTIKIGSQAPVPALGYVRSKHDTIPESFSFRVETGAYDKQNLVADYNSRTKTWRGLYYDRKTIANDVIFTKTPMSGSDQTQKSSTSAQKAASTKKKAAPVVNIEEPSEEIIVEEEAPQSNESSSSSTNILGEDTLK